MSERATKRWTKTVDEAFPSTGPKGRKGEEFMMRVFEHWGWEATHYESDRQKQVDGIDIEFRNPDWYNSYTCDVKANLNSYGSFEVHKDWLFGKKMDRVFHVNPDTGWITWYSVEDMQEVYDTSKEYMIITVKDRKAKYPFMRTTKVELPQEDSQEIEDILNWDATDNVGAL